VGVNLTLGLSPCRHHFWSLVGVTAALTVDDAERVPTIAEMLRLCRVRAECIQIPLTICYN
jgi:hypothetical protein